MDKITKYHQILCDLVDEYATIKKTLTPQIKSQAVIDKDNKHYQLLSIGWHNNKYVYMVSFHFDLIEDKVWIQQNNTDTLIADELIERGISRTDIVLGFIPEKIRNYAGFSIA